MRFVIDFDGARLPPLPQAATVSAHVRAERGSVRHVSTRRNDVTGGWRVSFDVVADADETMVVDLEASLRFGGRRLSETWVYQWSVR